MQTSDYGNDFTNETFSHGTFIKIGIFLLFVLTFGMVANSFILIILAKTKRIGKPHTTIVAGLIVGDLFHTFTLPFVVASSFAQRWLFQQSGCVFYAFMMTFLGVSNITLLATISVDRYLVIVKHGSPFTRNTNVAVATTLICFSHGLLWALFPVLGWSSFELELISCAVNWSGRTPENMSYTLSLMVCAWIIPLTALLFCYGKILHLVGGFRSKVRKRAKTRNQYNQAPHLTKDTNGSIQTQLLKVQK